jgi:RNA polymerase sigma factor (sigma-70 family)
MPTSRAPQSFQTTSWSVVRRAAEGDTAEARQALASLCEAYWYPLYAYFRRSGKSAPDAEDLTQGFFVRLLTHEILASADPDKGRLRTFLLACARNFLADQRDRALAQKRGAALLVQLDPVSAEERYALEPVDDLAPDRLFQRRWALTVLDHALQLFAAEYTAADHRALFEALRPFLGFGSEPERQYEEISAALGIPVGTLKNRVFRLRQRWRQILFEQVALTLENPTPEEIKGELSELLGCV